MTQSDYRKALAQLRAKPAKLQKYQKHNVPRARSCGRGLVRCTRCGKVRGHVGQYGLHLCRQCFREIALKIGFKKYM